LDVFYVIFYSTGSRDGASSSESWGGYFARGEHYNFFFGANFLFLNMILAINVIYFCVCASSIINSVG
jgi:hypothetical protein